MMNLFLLLQEIFQGFPIPNEERNRFPSFTRKYEAKDEQKSSLYKGARIYMMRGVSEHNVDA